MKRSWKFASAAGAGLAAAALLAAPAAAAAPAPDRGTVFVQNDSPSGNSIIAYGRTASGGLDQLATYRTGGKGGILSGSVVDHLASQGSLTLDRSSGLLYSVNAGSNSITTFAVHGSRLARRQVLSSGGQFPVSIAAHGNLVFVLNGRDGGSISGYLQIAGVLVPVPAWHRELHLNTSAPGQADEFTSTPGQIGFTPDGHTLLVATKNGGNSIEAFGVGLFGPSARPVITSLPGTVPFGFDFDARGHLALTEAGPSAVATFAVARSGALIPLDSVATGQAATCWIVAGGRTLYASNAGSGTVSAYTTDAGGQLSGGATTATDAGTVDAAAAGGYLYVQAGAAGIVDAYRIGADGALTKTGSVTVPDAAGAEGIAAL
ncbi:MAG TPA: beta-propeller fold lactonase family protein [Mycobacteriales bacterium]|nr:beta-propeller fold lactonase family protein [Mycobacteriales bacterium]